MTANMSRKDFIAARAAKKRASILRAAAARFAADGLERASMERIAAEAKVSTATLYRQFPSKLALFEDVLKDGIARFGADAGAPRKLDPKEHIERIAHAYYDLLDDPVRAGLIRVVMSAGAVSPDISALFYETVKSKVGQAVHDAMAAGVKAGAVAKSKDPNAPGALLMGAIEHMTIWRRLLSGHDAPQPRTAVVRQALDAFWRAWGK
jgi:TetR/AcrR family transcriptional regulator, regulator of autoinduction and epiphytic fitness